MSEIVDITPEELEYPELTEAGWYGPGFDNAADVELVEFHVVPKDSPDYVPNWDTKKGSDVALDNYMHFVFRVSSERDGVVQIRDWPRYFKGIQWLDSLGVAMERYEVEGKRTPGARFDPKSVAPRKLGGIKVRLKKGDSGTFYVIEELAQAT